MIDYLLIILAFIATVLGVWGDTLNNEKSGIKKIKLAGWIALVVALLVGIISVHSTMKNKHLEEESRKYPYTKLLNSVAPLERFLDLIYADLHGGKYFKDFRVEDLLNPDVLSKIEGQELQRKARGVLYGSKSPLLSVTLCESVELFFKRSEKAFEQYGEFIDREVMILVNNIKTTNLVRMVGYGKCSAYDKENTEGGKLRGYIPLKPIQRDDFTDFVNNVAALQSHLKKVVDK